MSRTLNNSTNDDAGYLQGIPVSTANPVSNDVLQYDSSTNEWEPHPVSSLPSVESIQNIGSGAGVWSNTTSGIASLKSLVGGTDINIVDQGSDLQINFSGSTPVNIYNTDGTLTGLRTVTLGGNKLVFGPQSSTSPAQVFIDPSSNEIGLFSFNGEVNIGDTTQNSTNVNSVNVNLVGGTSLNIDSSTVTFPKQSDGFLKTTSSNLSATTIALTDLSDVTLTSPQNNQLLSYNSSGPDWVNSSVFTYRDNQFITSGTFVANLDTIYVSSACNITLPTTGTGDIGRRIMISASQSVATNIIFTGSLFLVYNQTSYSGFTMSSSSGSVEFIVIGSNQYTFASISDRWGSGSLLTHPISAAMLNISDLQDCTITSPAANQILKYNGSKWVNSNPSFATNLIFNGRILSGSTLPLIFDWVKIADITYSSNASLNSTFTMFTNDLFDSPALIWDVMDYINDSPGTYHYVQPRNTNNWTFFSYCLYVQVDSSNTGKFNIYLQKGPSSSSPSTNTLGYYFNIYNYSEPSSYTYNIYTTPSVTSSSGYLGTSQVNPRQLITNFSGTNILTSTLNFNYLMNYNIRFVIWSEVDLPLLGTGTLNVLLNGISIGSSSYHSNSSTPGTGTVMFTDFGNALSLLSSSLTTGGNNLTFSLTGSGTYTTSNYKVSVILSL